MIVIFDSPIETFVTSCNLVILVLKHVLSQAMTCADPIRLPAVFWLKVLSLLRVDFYTDKFCHVGDDSSVATWKLTSSIIAGC